MCGGHNDSYSKTSILDKIVAPAKTFTVGDRVTGLGTHNDRSTAATGTLKRIDGTLAYIESEDGRTTVVFTDMLESAEESFKVGDKVSGLTIKNSEHSRIEGFFVAPNGSTTRIRTEHGGILEVWTDGLKKVAEPASGEIKIEDKVIGIDVFGNERRGVVKVVDPTSILIDTGTGVYWIAKEKVRIDDGTEAVTEAPTETEAHFAPATPSASDSLADKHDPRLYVGSVDYNKPIEVEDGVRATFISYVDGVDHPFVVRYEDSYGGVYIDTFDGDGYGDRYGETVVNIKEPQAVFFGRLIKDTDDDTLSFDGTVYDSREDAESEDTLTNYQAIVAVFEVANPELGKTSETPANDDGSEDADGSDEGGESLTSVRLGYSTVKVGDRVRFSRKGYGTRSGVAVKMRQHSRKSVFFRPDGENDGYWALNKNFQG